MKAIILAGGHATRLWPITKNRAKPLLPLGEKPIIDYIVDQLGEADEILISTNEKFEQDFEEYSKQKEEDIRVVVEEQDQEEDKPGTIGAIIKLLNQENLEDDLLIVGGDNYFGFDFKNLFEFCREKKSPVNVVCEVREEIATQFGIVDVASEGMKIEGFEEKPEEPPSTLASTAFYYFPEEHLDLYYEYEKHFSENTDVPADQFLDEPGRLIEWAHKQTDMYAYSFDGEWFDVGTLAGYLDAYGSVVNDKLVEGTVRDTEMEGFVHVMEDATVEDSHLKNSIVFPETVIKNSDVRNSIIDSDSYIEETDLNDALIGRHTQI